MKVSERIKAIRKSKGITQVDMSEKMGVGQSNYAYLEDRGDKLTIEQLGKIAVALGVTVEELLTDEPQTVQDSDRVKELEKRVSELEDRVNDKKFKIDTIEREYSIFRTLVFETLTNAVNHSSKIEDYVSVIENNKWLLPLLTGIPYNSLKIKDYHWSEFWSKAIEIATDKIFDEIVSDENKSMMVLPASIFKKKKYKRRRSDLDDSKFYDTNEEIHFLYYSMPTRNESEDENIEEK